MYVSARLDYALRALATLATEDGPVTGAVLAERQGVSLPYVAAILNELRREGLVVNERGRRPGYRLARPAEDMSIADVVAALHVWPIDVHTSDGRRDAVAERLAALWDRLGGVTVGLLASVSVADVARGPRSDAKPTSSRSRRRERAGAGYA
jgi:Rrf2 family protein